MSTCVINLVAIQTMEQCFIESVLFELLIFCVCIVYAVLCINVCIG